MSSGNGRCRRRDASAAAALALLALAAGCATTRPAPPSTIREVPAAPPPSQGRVVSVQLGKASWYGKEQHGHLTANGERFNMYALTAAHLTLHMNTRVRVTNLRNGHSVEVRINDRGPYGGRCIIDLSYAAAKALDMINVGIVPVRVEVLRP